jgi:hypothetical protein
VTSVNTSLPNPSAAADRHPHRLTRIALAAVLVVVLAVGVLVAAVATGSDESHGSSGTVSPFSPHEFCHAHVPC